MKQIKYVSPFHTASWEWRMAALWSWICRGKTACSFEDMARTGQGGNYPRTCVFHKREFPRKLKHSSRACPNTSWAKACSSCKSKQLARLEDKRGKGLFDKKCSRKILCFFIKNFLYTRMTQQEALVAALWLKRLLAGFST